MKKNYAIILFVLLVFIIVSIIILKNHNSDFTIRVKNPNRIGNDTNNILQGIDISVQDDYIYYSSIDGLFRTKIDSNEKMILDYGEISDLNVVGQWVYYSKKVNSERIDSGILVYYDLYKITINGKHKQRVIKDVRNVNIINDKIFYINGYTVIGIDNSNNNDINNSLIVSDLNGNNKQTIIKKDVDSMAIMDNYIYYESNGKMFVYDISKKQSELLMDKLELYYIYIVNGNNIIFYDDIDKQINEFIFDKKEIKNIANDVIRPYSMFVNNNTLYYTDSNRRLFAYDLDTNQKYEIDKGHGEVLFYYDKMYLLTGDNLIKDLKS